MFINLKKIMQASFLTAFYCFNNFVSAQPVDPQPSIEATQSYIIEVLNNEEKTSLTADFHFRDRESGWGRFINIWIKNSNLLVLAKLFIVTKRSIDSMTW